jgi:hypoxanthine phosphoribosyltransferase
MDQRHVAQDLTEILLSEAQILARVAELASEIDADYPPDAELVLLGLLNGAAMAAVDLARALGRHVEMAWMAVRSYGSGVTSSGSIELLKDVDVDLTGKHVVVVDDVLDTGLTASWVLRYLESRQAASVSFCAIFRKPGAPAARERVYIGFDVSDGFLVGYGLDYAGKYRNLRCCAILAPHVYEAGPTPML